MDEWDPPSPTSQSSSAGRTDMRRASEAMTRAANAMMAATEQFRRQFSDQQPSSRASLGQPQYQRVPLQLPGVGHSSNASNGRAGSEWDLPSDGWRPRDRASMLPGSVRSVATLVEEEDDSQRYAPNRPNTMHMDNGWSTPPDTAPQQQAWRRPSLQQMPVLPNYSSVALPAALPAGPAGQSTGHGHGHYPAAASHMYMEPESPPLPIPVLPDWAANRVSTVPPSPSIPPLAGGSVSRFQLHQYSDNEPQMDPQTGISVRHEENVTEHLNPNGSDYDGPPTKRQQIPRKPVSSSLPPPHPPPPSKPDMSLGREICFVLMVCLAQLLMLAGIAQALVPAFAIGQSFPDTEPGDLAWYSAAYGLTAGTFVLPAGRLGDLFGHKRIFILGFLWFGLWSLMAGLSTVVQDGGGQGTLYFIFCRALQGIGPALLVPNGQAMLGRTYPPSRRRNMVMCLFGACAPLGFVIGAVFSSLFAAKNMSWGWSFYVLAAVCVLLAAMCVVFLPTTELAKTPPGVSLWRRLDLPGMCLGVSGLVIFNVAWNQVPIVTFSTPYTYFLIIISVLLIAGFVYIESVAPYPLLPVNSMRSETNFVIACTAAGWGSFSIWIWYTVQFLEQLRHLSPIEVSLNLVPAPITGLAASLLVGVLMMRGFKPQTIMLISMVAFAVGEALQVTAPVEQSYWINTFLSVFIMPFGMDMSNPAATILVSNSVSKEHQGIAASLVVTAVNYSISVALGMAGTVERYVHEGGGDTLQAYRGAQYFGLGLGLLGVVLALVFVLKEFLAEKSKPKAKTMRHG